MQSGTLAKDNVKRSGIIVVIARERKACHIGGMASFGTIKNAMGQVGEENGDPAVGAAYGGSAQRQPLGSAR